MKKYWLGIILSIFILMPLNVKATICRVQDKYEAEVLMDKEKIGMNEKAFISINTTNQYEVKYSTINNNIISISEEGIITPLKYGNASIKVEVNFIENENTIATCPVNFNLEVVSNDSSLKTLNLEEADIHFNNDIKEYLVELPYSAEKVNIIAISNDAKAKITGIGRRYLSVGENTFNIEVTATDGSSTIYTIKVIRKEASNNNYLDDLYIDGYDISPTFNKDINKYTLEVNENTNKINIKTETSDERAKVKGDGNITLATGINNLTIEVEAENKDVREYVIEVTRLNGTSSLNDLKIEGYNLNFKKDTYTYYLDVSSNIDTLNIKPKYDSDTKIEIVGNKDLKEGINEIYLNVLGNNKSKSTYKIVVNKLSKEEEEKQEKNNKLLRILLVIFIISVIIMFSLILIFIKRNFKKRYVKDFKNK